MRQEIALLKKRLKAHHGITMAELNAAVRPSRKRKFKNWAEALGDDPDDPDQRRLTVHMIERVLRGDPNQTDLEDFTK